MLNRPIVSLIFEKTVDLNLIFGRRDNRLIVAAIPEQERDVIEYGKSQGWRYVGASSESVSEEISSAIATRDFKPFFE